MSSKLSTCKVCGAEVAKSAKTCPQCGAKIKKGNPILIGILVFVLLLGVFGSSGGDDEPKKVETGTPAQSAETSGSQAETAESEPVEEKNEFYVGETAELKGVKTTFVSMTESTGSTYNTPADGNVFVICEFEITNDSNSDVAVSSMASFEAYCDDYACTYSLGALLEKNDKNQLDGTVAPGKKMKGVVGYEIPADWAKLEVVFTPDVWSGKTITFVAENN